MADSSKIEIVDCHHHLWDLTHSTYPWLNGPNPVQIHSVGDINPIRKDYLIQNYLEDTKNQNIIKSVHVQAERSNHLEEVRWLQSVADSNDSSEGGFPHGIVAGGRLAESDWPNQLKAYTAFKNFRGVRQLLDWSEDNPKLRQADRGDYLKDPKWLEGYALLGTYDRPISFDLHCMPWQADDAVELLKKHPNIPVILDHTGLDPYRTKESFEKWREAITKYASVDHLYIKLSGLWMFDHNWSAESFKPYILTAISTFGVDRCAFASNFPVDKIVGSYDKLFNTFKEVVSDFSPEEKTKLFKANAEKFYRI